MSERNRLPFSIPLLDSEAGRKSVRKTCGEHGVREKDLYDLLVSQMESPEGARRKKLFSDFDSVFGEGDENGEREENVD